MKFLEEFTAKILLLLLFPNIPEFLFLNNSSFEILFLGDISVFPLFGNFLIREFIIFMKSIFLEIKFKKNLNIIKKR